MVNLPLSISELMMVAYEKLVVAQGCECIAIGFRMVDGATLENKATKPGTSWYVILGYMPIFSSTLFETTAPCVAHEESNSEIEFEFLCMLPSPEIMDRVFALTPTSDLSLQTATSQQTGAAAVGEEDRITFAFSIASPSKNFGETLGCGRGPSHGMGFDDTDDMLVDEFALFAPICHH
jgi:hypothetical protein